MELRYRKILAIMISATIALITLLTLLISPTKILGGFVKGFIDAPEGSTILQRVEYVFRSEDYRMNEFIVIHDPSVHAYGGIQRLLHKTLINDTENQVLKLNNGYLAFKNDGFSDFSKLKEYLFDLKDVCDETGSRLLFVHKNSKDTEDPTLLPAFYPYCVSSNFSEVRPELEANGIPVLDLAEQIEKEGLDKYSLFYKTDHHWIPQTGLWVSRIISDLLNQEFDLGLKTELMEPQQYCVENYPRSYLGSQGQRVGALYAGIDDFAVVYPRFETHYEVEYCDSRKVYSGDFRDTFLFEKYLTPNKLLNRDATAYMTYMNGNHSLVRVANKQLEDGKTALVIMDSYGCVVAPYLSTVFKKMDCIDIRSYTETVEQYIRENQPDVVIYCISTYQKG